MAGSAGKIERGKLLDASLAAVILIIFSAVPLGVRLGDEADVFPDTTAEVAYTGCVGVSWIFFLSGAIVLFIAWYRTFARDHGTGKGGIERKREGSRCVVEIGFVSMAAVSAVLVGSLLLLGAVITAAVQQAQVRAGWLLAADAVSACVLMWCGVTFVILLRQARRNAAYPSHQRRVSKSPSNSISVTQPQDLSVHSETVVNLRSTSEHTRDSNIRIDTGSNDDSSANNDSQSAHLTTTLSSIASTGSVIRHATEGDDEHGNGTAFLVSDHENDLDAIQNASNTDNDSNEAIPVGVKTSTT